MEEYDDVHAFLKNKLQQLQEEGSKIKSTNSNNSGTLKEELIELPHQFFCITNPAATIFNLPHFRTQPWWMVGELLTEFLALNPPLMSKYSPDIIEASYKLTPQGTCEYLYGTRWAEHNQLENARKKLVENPTSKKLIIQTWMPQDGEPHRKDSPCNVNYMLLAREGKLDLTATIRSNDIMRGVKYDYYLAAFMQQSLAAWSGMQVGKLYFSINSLHLYNKDSSNLEQLLGEIDNYTDNPIRVKLDAGKIPDATYWDGFRHLKRGEEAAYNGAWDSVDYQINKNGIRLFRDFTRIMAAKNAKHYDKLPMHKRYLSEIENDEVKRWVGSVTY